MAILYISFAEPGPAGIVWVCATGSAPLWNADATAAEGGPHY